MNIITSVLESMTVAAALERLTAEQQEVLVTAVLNQMLVDATIDPRTKTGIRMGFQHGMSQFIGQVYDELSGEMKKVDPTIDKKYVNFMLRMYSKGGTDLGFFLNDEFRDHLMTYEELKKRNRLKPPYNDINRFATVDEFTHFLDTNKNDIVLAQEKQGQSTTVYEDDEVKIVVPLDETAACRYGKGTKWCVSALAANKFDDYNAEGQLYFLLPKQPQYNKEKYAFHFASGSFVDETDKSVRDYINTIMTKRFGDLIEKYFKDNPDYTEWVEAEETDPGEWFGQL